MSGNHTQSTHLYRCSVLLFVYIYILSSVLVTPTNNFFSHAICSLFSLLHVEPCTSANPTSSTNTKNKGEVAGQVILTITHPPYLSSLPVSPHFLLGLESRVEREEEEQQGRTTTRRQLPIPMCCYVGKATKIFLCLVAALLVAGLVLGFGLARHTWGANRTQPDCRWPNCQQQQGLASGGDPLLLPVPVPATATTPTNPLTQPAVAAFPGATATPSSSSAGVAAPPTGVPYFGPPGPFVVGLGPSAHV